MSDVLTITDLQAAKKHDTFHSEVITGKTGGVAGGADIDTATNAVTGQVQTTLPKVLRDVGFKPASFTFVTGGTLGVSDADKCIYNPAPAGDDNWYSWSGSLPHTVAPGADPTAVGSGYVPRTDVLLRSQLAASTGAEIIGTAEGITLSEKLSLTDYAKYPSCAEFKNRLEDGDSAFGIECWGDSTMWGSISNNAGAQETKNPVVMLDESLWQLYKPNNPTVVSKAIPGTNLNSMINGLHLYSKPFDQEMAESTASVIYCNHAQNDCNSYASTVDQYRENLVKFVNICRKYGKVPVLVTPNTTFVIAGITEAANKRLPSFVDAMRDVAKTMSVDLVDNYYYYQQTARSVPMSELVPDGVHPSTKAYGMSGRNLAIPLIAAKSLRNPYDGAGLSNVSWKDEITNSRSLQVNSAAKYGNVMIGQADATAQRLSYPVILDNPTDDNVLAINVLSWYDGGKMAVIHNGSVTDTDYVGNVDVLNGISNDYRGVVAPDVCNLYAGLHVIGVFTGAGLVAGSNKMSLGGVTLIPRIAEVSAMNRAVAVANRDRIRAVMIGDTIDFTDTIGASDQYLFQLAELAADTAPWFYIVKRGADLIINQYGAEVTLVSSVAAGMYDFRVTINVNRTITVKCGATTVTTAGATSGAPLSYITTYGRQQPRSYFISR